MKIELEKVAGAVVVIAGIVYGYGELNNKVDNLQEYNDTEIRQLADNNMNDIIELKTKMNLLVTSDMKIVPSNDVALIDQRVSVLEKRKPKEYRLPKHLSPEAIREIQDGIDELFDIVDTLEKDR